MSNHHKLVSAKQLPWYEYVYVYILSYFHEICIAFSGVVLEKLFWGDVRLKFAEKDVFAA